MLMKNRKLYQMLAVTAGVLLLSGCDASSAQETGITSSDPQEPTTISEETKAPEGYSINVDGASATIKESKDKNVTVPTSLKDTKLSALPSTGGIGTTIFTIGGCVVMIAAAGLFFATRKKSAK